MRVTCNIMSLVKTSYYKESILLVFVLTILSICLNKYM